MAKTYKFNRYRDDARVEPFVLEVGEDETIEISMPDGETMLEIEESGSSRVILELLTGKHYERVWELVRHEPAKVLNNLARDMAQHFGLDAASAGFTRSSR